MLFKNWDLNGEIIFLPLTGFEPKTILITKSHYLLDHKGLQ